MNQATQETVRLVVVGHVDHGKSTLIGRIFYDTGSLPQGKLEAIRKACATEGMQLEYSFLMDALLEEQQQNITIDTTEIHFRTPRREYVIIDAPGHKEFLKNMVTGASRAEAAILIIDAQEGIREQSRRHLQFLSLLNVRQIVVAINKMDLVGYSQNVFEGLRSESAVILEKVDLKAIHHIPISAKFGDNVASSSAKMPWYKGPTVVEALDSLRPATALSEGPLRLVVQDIYRFDHRRIIAGRIESGTLRVGDEVVFVPYQKRSKVASIELWNAETPPAVAYAGESVAITLEDQIFVERGQVACHVHSPAAETREWTATVFWLGAEPLCLNRNYEIRLGTQKVQARVIDIQKVVDAQTLEPAVTLRSEVARYEVAVVRIRVKRPVVLDQVDVATATGRFVIYSQGRIAGGGTVTNLVYPKVPASAVVSDNISWTVGYVSREERAELFGHRGAVYWFTGLSGSGKSTLATALERLLTQRGIHCFVLDGDNLRHGLCSDLGFSDKDRAENIRRAGEVAKLIAEAGLIVLTSLISPFRVERQRVREICTSAGIPFVEVYLSAPLSECEKRDPKGLYRRARAGEIRNFTGIESPYEIPLTPDITLPTHQLTVDECLKVLLNDVEQRISLQFTARDGMEAILI